MTRWTACRRRPGGAATPAPGPGCRPSSWPSRATPHRQIARALGFSRRAVQAWVAAYNRGGLEALPDRPHPGRTPTLPQDQEARFLERIEAPPRPEDGVCELRGADIRRILEQEFAARYSLSGVYKLLHRLGYSDLMPRPQHPDADPEAQEFFKEIVVEQIEAIAEQHPDQEVQVWHQDEARFGQQGTLTRVWARRGSRPRRVRQNGRESLYVLTAACAASGAAFGLIMPELNTAVVNLFLEEFSRQLAPGVHAVLLWDNARYHTGGGAGGAGEREPDRAAAVLAGVEPGGEPVALPAVASLVEPGLCRLRGPAGRGDGGLEGRLPGPGEDPVDLRGSLPGRTQIILPIRIRSPPTARITAASRRVAKSSRFKHSSRSRPLLSVAWRSKASQPQAGSLEEGPR